MEDFNVAALRVSLSETRILVYDQIGFVGGSRGRAIGHVPQAHQRNLFGQFLIMAKNQNVIKA